MPRQFGIYPGGMGRFFGPDMFYQAQQIQGAPYGGEYAAEAADPAVSQYYGTQPSFNDMMIPGMASDAFRRAALGSGLTGADVRGNAATLNQRGAGIKGALDATNQWANSKYSLASSQMGLENARNQAANQQLGIFGGLAQPFFGQGGLLMGGGNNPGLIPNLFSGGGSGQGIFSNLAGPTGIMGLLKGLFASGGPMIGGGADVLGSLGGGTDLLSALSSAGSAGGLADLGATFAEAAPFALAA